MALQGSRELRRRLKALRGVFKPLGKAWAEDTRDAAKRRIRKRTGKTAASIRVRNASTRRATVVGSYKANFIDAGTKAHDITAKRGRMLKFNVAVQGPVLGGGSLGGRTIFSKKVHKPRTTASPFKRAAALEGLQKNPLAGEVVRQWNEAVR